MCLRIIPILVLNILFLCSFLAGDKVCIKGDIQYFAADYSEEFFLKPMYQKSLTDLLHKPVQHYFCSQEIKNLPIVDKNRGKYPIPSQSYTIEPLFIDLDNFNGIYGTRIHSLKPGTRNIRWQCGFQHYLFLISNHEYIDLTRDTLQNLHLIQKHLGLNFTKEELLRMQTYYQEGDICAEYTTLPPTYIKKGDQIVFDASKE